MTVPTIHHTGEQQNGTTANGVNGHGSSYKLRNKPIHSNRHLRVICIGAGASGIYMAYRLKTYFTDFTLHVYEKNEDLGGTWFENRYPGCACDVPAHNYTYSFSPKWDWSANYASSKEIFAYFSDFVDKYKLREYIHSSHEVIGAKWNETKREWDVEIKIKDGSTFHQSCDFLINAAGILNNWRWPGIPGLQSFKGDLVHSAAWNEELDLTGKHVGLIGNGSSGIQILPKVQKIASHVTTFIREPSWISPTQGMEYHLYTDEEKKRFRDEPGVLLKLRQDAEIGMSRVFPLFIKGSATQKAITEYMQQQMRTKINDEALSEKLIPQFAVGCRRLTPGVNYLESLTLPNVTTIYGEISKVTPEGCVTADGKEWPLDALICATGFDTTFKPRFPLIGQDGRSLADEWAEEPRSYLGLAADGFPNYFMFLGPNCPIGNGPIIFSIELQGEYMSRFMNRWQKEDLATISPRVEAINDFMQQKDAFMETTVWSTGCESWYKNPKTGKITALWPGSTPHYMEALASPRYDDFHITYNGNRFGYLGNGFSQGELNPNIDLAYYIREKDTGESLCRPLESTHNVKDITDVLNQVVDPTL